MCYFPHLFPCGLGTVRRETERGRVRDGKRGEEGVEVKCCSLRLDRWGGGEGGVGGWVNGCVISLSS